MTDHKHNPGRRTHPQSWGEANHPDAAPSWAVPDMGGQGRTPEPKKQDKS